LGGVGGGVLGLEEPESVANIVNARLEGIGSLVI
jgi:hypothetical protein